MCTSPIKLKNPYYGIGDKGINYLHNTHTSYIEVPCGNCIQCLSMRQAWFNQRVQMESLRSHLFFMTLTYNDQSLSFTDIGEYKIAYPNYSDVQNMFKRVRKRGYNFLYWIVSEYGTQRKRPHFHAIIAVEKSDIHHSIIERDLGSIFLKEWRKNIGSTRSPIYVPCCDYIRKRVSGKLKTTFDFHYIESIKDHDNDLSFYISKYILKFDSRTEGLLAKIRLDPSLDDKQTSSLISDIKPRSVMSKSFGDYRDPRIAKYINDCLSRSPDLPQFFDINTGRSSLLSPYYRKHFVTVEYMQSIYDRLSIGKEFNSMLLPNDSTMYDYALNADTVFAYALKLKKQKYFLNQKF